MPVSADVSQNGHVPLIVSIDVGTTSSRVLLFNKFGKEVTRHQIEYSTSASSQKYTPAGARRKSLNDYLARAQAGDHTPKTIYSSVGMMIEENDNLEIEDLNEKLTEKRGPTLRYPKPGWIECNPTTLLINVLQCLALSLNSLNRVNTLRMADSKLPYKVKCIGITNMRETTIVWSKRTGMPVIDYGIVWNDTRNGEIIRQRERDTPAEQVLELQNKTGLPLFSTYFSCSKLRWLLDNEPKVREHYESGDLMFGTVDTWLLYHLTSTNEFVSDVTNASRTGFMDLEAMKYDDMLLNYWGIDRQKINLPTIKSSAEFYGTFRAPEPLRNEFPPNLWDVLLKFQRGDIPIQGCLGDQSASLVGQMAYTKGSAKCTYGTGCFLLYNTGTQKLISKHGALTTIGFWFPYLTEGDDWNQPHFALEGSVAVAGSVVQWLRDNLRLINRAQDVGPLANEVPDSGGVVFVPAFSGLFAPYWDGSARATIMGISQFTTASHIARAAVEGVCFQARAILKAMSSDAYDGDISDDIDLLESGIGHDHTCAYEKSLLSTLSVDGGMSRSDEVMQIQADILGPCIKIRRSPVLESTALGAAIAANMAYKTPEERVLWKDLKDAKKWIFYRGHDKNEEISQDQHPNLKVFRSQSEDEERRKHWKMWEAAIARSRGWLRDAEGEHPQVLEE
ncbi:glycerol kinase KNAG_0J02920 [Huiozyma naganishii CBS 8797]|uniref:glycerol kinase n=1 Tax=Huiozyma naganishii (strain ATCC MYA-139 / BCRC 22969 / CBS 8797 / KCTC 17520 / NBRC 10181 / NCYC 3082 / Yp74L-3) TaxID=1071383 RepID=J7SAQ1_HUIN7|nr:hypothetical protein KNAG_0J02920 [Kazachstania naganishii CBS 8797]CCK72371.1 hypothetical protein KNAG_0J02920 [Kazachstania naganishii CBS 8797]